MLRNSRLVLGLVVTMTIAAGDAHAQYGYPGGYGGYGWGGWGGSGSTVQGSIAQGLGYYAMGAGQYNLDTAQATSINADTVMRWNNWMYQSQMEANRLEYARLAALQKRDSSTGEALYQRFRDNPTTADIEHGDALNVILDQLTDPRIHSSALRLARTKLNGEDVDDIPFVHASDAVVISMHKLLKQDDWPIALRDDDYAPLRKAYQDALAKALDEDTKGDLTPKTAAAVKNAVSDLHDALEKSPPTDRLQLAEARDYIKGLTGISRMLERPNVGKVIGELEKIKTTSVGHLLGFMHSYNLRFGVARTDREKVVYRELYPILDVERDRILKEAEGTSSPVASNSGHKPTDFFRGMDSDTVKGKVAPPPRPNNQ